MPDAIPNSSNTPRRSLWTTIGPSIVVLGSVVGAGELINTPVQAAKFGFVLLWAVLLACVLRVFLQVEIGRHCLVHRRTTIQALNTCPGPRWRGTSWIGLLYMALYVLLLLPSVGMIGALGGLSHTLWPLAATESRSAGIWATIITIVTWGVLSTGAYRHLEKLVIALVAVFSITTIGAVLLLQGTPFAIRVSDILAGLKFSRGPHPQDANYAIVSLMGALGITANELFMYPYWIQEKGYGADLVHHRGETWTNTARRWIRSLWLDIGLATVLTTLVTVAFFLLGCAVLHRQHLEPTGLNVINTIGQVYVDTYGPWSLKFFYFGVYCTLASTLIVAVAASGRMVSDLLGSLGYIDRNDPQVANRVHKIAQPIWLLAILTAYLVVKSPPEKIVIFGQFLSGGFALPLIAFGICWMAFHTDQRVRMSRVTAALLLFTSAAVFAFAVLGMAHTLGLT